MPSFFSIILRIYFPSAGGRKSKVRRILHEPVGGTHSKACLCRFFSLEKTKIWPAYIFYSSMFNIIKQNPAKKLDPTLKPNHLKSNKKSYLESILRTKVQIESPTTPFLRDRTRNLAHVFYIIMPFPRPDLMFFFSSFFFFRRNILV